MESIKDVVSEKISNGSLTTEEAETISEESIRIKQEEALKEAIKISCSEKDSERFPAGMLFGDKPPEGSEVLIPSGYIISPLGVFFQGEQSEWTRITRIPFFIASRTRTHSQLLDRKSVV